MEQNDDVAFLDGVLALHRLTPVMISQAMKPPAALWSQRYAGGSDIELHGLRLLHGRSVVNAVVPGMSSSPLGATAVAAAGPVTGKVATLQRVT